MPVRWRTHDGAAKRRKLAGTYPNANDPLAAARRFWCGRAPGRAEDFTAPAGTVAITLDVQGWLSTVLIDASKVVDIDGKLTAGMMRLDYSVIVRTVAHEFVEIRKSGDDTRLTGVGLGALWTALHHPASGERMRRAISAALRKNGKAHISWHCGPHGLAMSLSKGYVDQEPLMKAAPRDRMFVYPADDDEPERGH
jgi:hypothetical protein